MAHSKNRMLTLAVTFGPTLLTARSRSGAGRELIHLDSALEPSDAELARRAGGGDRWAEEAFYRRHVREVVGLAQRLLGNSWDAEDVAQETFIAAFQLWGQLRDSERARSWLMQIAVRQVHRKFRKRRLLRLLGLDHAVDDLPLDALAHDDTSAEVRSELMVLESVLKSMPAKRKIAWMLRHVEGLPLEEVAQQCDCSLATAKRRIAAAQRAVCRKVEITGPADD
jgi:RNA polymerase sigma-70 factor (ECF subfamily)